MYSNKNLARSLFEKIKQGCLSLIASNNRYGRRVPETDILVDTRINQMANAWDIYADYVKAVECQADPQIVSDIIDGNHPPMAEFQHSLMLNTLSHFIPTVNVLQGVYNEYYVGEDTSSSIRSGLILQIPTAIYDILTVLMCVYWTSANYRNVHIFRPEVRQLNRQTQSNIDVEQVRGELWALQVQCAISHVDPKLLEIFINTIDGEHNQELYYFAKIVYLQLGNIWKPINETSGVICITGNATANDTSIKVIADGLRVLLRCTQEVLQTIEMPLSVYLAEHAGINSTLSLSAIVDNIIEDMYKNSNSEIKYVSDEITNAKIRVPLPGILRSEIDAELFDRIGDKYQKVFDTKADDVENVASEEVEENPNTCDQEAQDVASTVHVNPDGLVVNDDGFILLADGTIVRESVVGGYECRQEASVGTLTMVVWCPITLQQINAINSSNPVRPQVRPNQYVVNNGTPPVDRVEAEVNNIISDINLHVHGLHVVHEVEANNMDFGDEEDFDIVSPEDFYAGLSEPIEDMLNEENDDDADDYEAPATTIRIALDPEFRHPTFTREVDDVATTAPPIADEGVATGGIRRVYLNREDNEQAEFVRTPRPGVLSAADIARILGQADAEAEAQTAPGGITLENMIPDMNADILRDIIPDMNTDNVAQARLTLNEDGVVVQEAEAVQQERRLTLNGQQISVRVTDTGVRISR